MEDSDNNTWANRLADALEEALNITNVTPLQYKRMAKLLLEYHGRRRAFSTYDAPQEVIDAISRAEVPPGHEYLDELLNTEPLYSNDDDSWDSWEDEGV